MGKAFISKNNPFNEDPAVGERSLIHTFSLNIGLAGY